MGSPGLQAAVHEGRPFYGTAFGEPSGLADKVETIGEVLASHGFSYQGKDFLTSGEGLPSLASGFLLRSEALPRGRGLA